MNQGYHDPLLAFINLLEWLVAFTETLMFTGLLYNKGMLKNTDEYPDEELHRARSRGSQEQELLSPWSWDVPPSWHIDVFTSLEAL